MNEQLKRVMEAGEGGKARELEIYEALKAQRGDRYAAVAEYAAASLAQAHLLTSAPAFAQERLLEAIRLKLTLLSAIALQGTYPPEFGPEDERMIRDMTMLFNAKITTLNAAMGAL